MSNLDSILEGLSICYFTYVLLGSINIGYHSSKVIILWTDFIKVIISHQSISNRNVIILLWNFVALISMQIYEQLLLEYIELPLILYIVYSSAILMMFVVNGIIVSLLRS